MHSKTLTQKEFNTKSNAFVLILGPNIIAYKIPTEEWATISPAKTPYDGFYLVANEDMKDTLNHVQVGQLTDATATYKPVLAHIETAWVKNNPFIPNSIKIACFVHIDSHVRHIHNGPVTIPVPGLPDLNTPRNIGMYYRDSLTPNKTAKPDPDDVCEAWVTFDTGAGAVFNYRCDSSTDHIVIPFTDAEVGKPVTIRLCWKNKKGRGEFSLDIKATVPG